MSTSTPSYPATLSLTGRRAVVVGGTRGLGEAVVRRLAAAGARVLAVGRTAPVATCADRVVTADLTRPDAAAAVAAALDPAEGLDVVVHVAGGSGPPVAATPRSPTPTGTPNWPSTCWAPSASTAR